jgi:hypothetical protein
LGEVFPLNGINADRRISVMVVFPLWCRGRTVNVVYRYHTFDLAKRFGVQCLCSLLRTKSVSRLLSASLTDVIPGIISKTREPLEWKSHSCLYG